MSAFNDFADEAAEYFGLNAHEAANLYDLLEEVYGFDESDTLREYAGEAADLLDVVTEDIPEEGAEEEEESGYEGEESPYELDDDFPDDDWLDPGEEWEVSTEYEES